MKNSTQFSINDFLPKKPIDPHVIELEIIRDKRYEKYGIPVGVFTSEYNSVFTKDEEEAMHYLNLNLELPKELEQRLINSLPERLERNKQRKAKSDSTFLTEKDIERLFKVKL